MPDPITPETEAEARRRRRNLVEIEASPEALALATILGQSPEEFVAAAVQARVAALAERVREAVRTP